MLTLPHAASSSPAVTRLPQIRDIEVSLSDADDAWNADPRAQAARLLPGGPLPHALPRHRVFGCARAVSEPDAVNTALRRTWRWHHLLRGGRSGLLSPEEQKGLIGELFVLGALSPPAAPSLSRSSRHGSGPLGSPKDFEVRSAGDRGQGTARERASRTWRITSEHQLDSDGVMPSICMSWN